MSLKDLTVDDQTLQNELHPTFGQTREQEFQQQQAEEQQKSSLGEAFRAARWLDSSESAMAHIVVGSGFEPDPTYLGPSAEQLKQTGLPVDFWPELSQAVSEEHFNWLAGNARDDLASEQKLQEHGLLGMGIRLGVNLLDPGAIGLSIATLPAAEVTWPGLAAFKAQRLRRAIQMGLLAGAENAALTMLQQPQRLTTSWEQVAYATLGGLAFGSVLGAVTRGGSPDVVDDATRHANIAIDDLLRFRVQQEAELTGTGHLSAAKVTGPLERMAEAPDMPGSATAAPTVFTKARVDLASKMLDEKMPPAVRGFADDTIEDATGRVGHAVNSAGGSVSQWRRLLLKRYRYNFYKVHNDAFAEWRKATGISTWEYLTSPLKTRTEFNRLVWRTIDQGVEIHPAVTRMANQVRQLYAEVLQDAKRAKVWGADMIPENPDYVPHMWVPSAVRRAVDIAGRSRVVEAFKQGLLARSDDLEPELAERIARGMVRNFEQRANDPNQAFVGQLSLMDAEELTDILKADAQGRMTDEEIEGIVDELTRHQKARGQGQPSHFKRRLRIDTNIEIQPGLRLWDLLETDIEKVTTGYLNKLTGLTAFAKKGYGVKNPLTVDLKAAKDRMRAELVAQGTKKDDEISKVMERVDLIERALRGMPLEPIERSAEWYKLLRLLQDVNYIRFMGQTGAASLAETGQAIAYAGIRNALRQMPSFRDILFEFRKGLPRDELMQELDATIGAAGHTLTNQVASRWFEHDIEFMRSALRRLDDAVQVGKKLTSRFSGLVEVTDVTQRIAARGMIQRIYNQARAADFEKVWAKEWRRMHLYGVTKQTAKRFHEEILKHAETRQGSVFKSVKVARLNLHKWDPQVADDFAIFMHRFLTHAVQEEDIGNLPSWLHPLLVRLFFQFRRFMLGAYAKTTLNGIHMHDAQAALGFLMSMVFGWQSYVLQNLANAPGRKDAEEWLDERLSWDRQIAAAFNRSAFSSVIPGFLDSLALIFGQDPLFRYARTTGLSTGLIDLTSVPLMDTAARLGLLVPALGAVLPGRELTERESDALLALFSNMWVLRNVVAALDAQLELPSKPSGN